MVQIMNWKPAKVHKLRSTGLGFFENFLKIYEDLRYETIHLVAISLINKKRWNGLDHEYAACRS